MDMLSSQTDRVLDKALDGTMMRHRAIATNIAHAETPHFREVKVDFEDQLRRAIEAENGASANTRFLPPGSLKTSDPRHFNPNPVPGSVQDAHQTVAQTQFEYRQDGNGVDMEVQMAHLAKNTNQYNAMTRMRSKLFENYRQAMRNSGV